MEQDCDIVLFLVNQMKEDLHRQRGIAVEEIRTIATGALNSMLAPITNIFDRADKSLTINGLLTIARYALK